MADQGQGARQSSGRGGNPNDLELRAERMAILRQIEELEDQLGAADEGADTAALEQQIEQLEEQHADLRAREKDARRANLEARKSAGKARG